MTLTAQSILGFEPIHGRTVYYRHIQAVHEMQEIERKDDAGNVIDMDTIPRLIEPAYWEVSLGVGQEVLTVHSWDSVTEYLSGVSDHIVTDEEMAARVKAI